MNLEQRIQFIKEKLLSLGDMYACTMAARDCLLIIEVAFRELLRRHADKLLPSDRQKLQQLIEGAIKGSRAKGIDDFTLGQLVGIIRDSKFFDAWSKATGKPLTGIRWIELNNLTSYRNERLVHVNSLEELLNPDLQVTSSEAYFLLYCLNIILETFGIESLENPPVTVDEKTLPSTLSKLLPNPYRGLEPFREQDAAYFFGRTAKIADLKDLVTQRRFIAVIGNSGSGKSSLVFAGLIPALRHSQQWFIASCRPKNEPLRQLSSVLIDTLYQTELNEVTRLSEITALSRSLEQQEFAIAEVIKRIFDKHPTHSRFLLIIDQFEELYTLAPEPAQQSFIALLWSLCTEATLAQLTVLITIRADFMGYALSHAGLAQLLDADRHKMLGDLGEAGLLAAITHPAQALGVKFEEGLAERIVQDVGVHAGQLPLLQFALHQLWERRLQNTLTHTGYEAIGTVTEALARHADLVYAQFSEAGQAQVRRLLIQMVRPGEGTEDTRQVAPLSQFANTDQKTIIRRLADERLVVTGAETVEIVHEALLRYWQPLREWMKEDRAFRVWQENVRRDVRDQVLLRETRLAVAREWLEKRRGELTAEELAFIAASVQQRDQERATRRRWVVGSVVATGVFVVMLLGGLWREVDQGKKLAQSFQQVEEQRNHAEQQRQEATRNLQEAQKTQSLFLADLSRQQTEQGNAVNGMLLALEGLPKNIGNLDRPFVVEVHHALYAATLEQREIRIFEHEGSVNHIEFSPDGQRVVTASNDNTAKVWEVASGKLLATLAGHEGGVEHAAFSPDGQRVVTASDDKTAEVWDTASGKLLATLAGHESRVTHATFSPDGQRVVTASDDDTAKLWEVVSGKLLITLAGHKSYVTHVEFSPDGQRLVTASGDKTARVWETASGKLLATLTGHEREVTHAAFSPDGKRVVTASDDNTAKLWEVVSGKLFTTLAGHKSYVTHAAFSPNGQRVVTASLDNIARVWEVTSGKLLATLAAGHEDGMEHYDKTTIWREIASLKVIATIAGHKGFVAHAAFSPEGQRVVTISDDNTAKLWEAASGKLLATLAGHEGRVNHAAFSPDGQRVVTASNDNTAKLWEVTSDQLLATLAGHKSYVTHAAFSPDGQRVVTASDDNTAKLWEVASVQLLATLAGHEDTVNYAAFSPDGQRVVTASSDKTAKVWDTASGKLLATLAGHKSRVTHATFSPDGQRVVTASSDKTAKVWDTASGKLLATLAGHKSRVTHATFSPDGQRVVTASDDKTAKMWDTASGKLLATLAGHEREVNHAAFSPDGQQVVTASSDKTAKVWEAASSKLLATLAGHEGGVEHAAFSPDGQRLVTASNDNTAKLWEVASGQLLATLLAGHRGSVNHAAFSPDGQRLVTTVSGLFSEDKTAKLWEAASGKLLATLAGHEYYVNHAAFSPDGQRLVTASSDNTAKIWLVGSQAIIDYARAHVPRQLTKEQRKQFFLE